MLVEAFGHRVALHRLRARHHPGAHALSHLAATHDGGRRAQVGDAAVGARADEHPVDLGAHDRRAGRQPHVVEGRLHAAAPAGIGNLAGVGNALVDGDHMLGAGAPGDLRRDRRHVDGHLAVELRVGVARQLAPGFDGAVPHRPLGCELPSLDVGVGRLVGRDEPHLGAELDGEIADGEPPLDAERADGAAGVLYRIAGAARRADLADQAQYQVLGRHAQPHLAVERRAQSLGAALHQRLGGENVRQLARSDAEGERPHAAVRAGVAVAADDERAGQAQPQLRPHHVHDALSGLVDVEEADAGLARLGAQRHEQLGADLRGAGSPRSAGDGVVGGGERQVRAHHLDAAALQIEQPARAAEIVQQMPVHVQQVGVVAEIGDHVGIPDLGKQGAGGHGERLVPSLGDGDSRERAIRLVNASTVRGQLPCAPRRAP